jgi:hypothetical protein
MKITLCGSITFIDEMLEVKTKLEAMGHEVKLPLPELFDQNGDPLSVKDFYTKRKQAKVDDAWVWNEKAKAIHAHFDKVVWSDAILVLNYNKNNISGYIGANTLMEMGLAFHLRKKIFLLTPVPQISYQEEIFGMHPSVIKGDLSEIL